MGIDFGFNAVIPAQAGIQHLIFWIPDQVGNDN